jgi:hypothetical protein
LRIVYLSNISIIGKILQGKLNKLFDEFEIKQKVFFATKDEGSNVTKNVKDLQILSHTCGQHKFNYILKNQINKDSKIKQLLNDVVTISSFFKRSKANRIFENI